MKVLFWIRRNKVNGRGECAIYCRITVNGTRANEFSTGVFIPPNHWNAKRQMINNHPLKQALLNEIQNKADMFYLDIIKNREYPSAEAIKNKIRQDNRIITISDLLKQNYDDCINRSECLATHNKQRQFLNNIMSFLVDNRIETIPCEGFGNKEAERLKDHLIKNKYGSLTINKHLSFIKNTLKLGVKRGYISNYNIVISNEKLESSLPVFLNQEEIKQLTKADLPEHLERIRDCFVFQCYTGLAYADLKAFDYRKHVFTEKNQKWITKEREKTAVKSHLPLLQKAETILSKYHNKLPILSNQKYNKYLKQVANLCDINQHLTTHIARKTFGNIMLNAGVSIETVASMMGHDKIETTQKFYAKVDKRRIIGEIELINKAA